MQSIRTEAIEPRAYDGVFAKMFNAWNSHTMEFLLNCSMPGTTTPFFYVNIILVACLLSMKLVKEDLHFFNVCLISYAPLRFVGCLVDSFDKVEFIPFVKHMA